MKILLINELFEAGGTEVQSKREIKAMSLKNYEYYFLTFDPNIELIYNNNHHYNIPIRFSKIKKIIHRFIATRKYTKKIRKVINEIKPDVVHINNVINLPIDVYKSVIKIPTFQTIRDYGAVCPKSTCIYNNYEKCDGIVSGNCNKCCNTLELKYNLLSLKKINKIRKKSINAFICPSESFTNACNMNGIKTECVNNQFDFSIVKKHEPSYNKKNFFYYGKVSEEKGVSLLIECFKKISLEFPKYKLIIAGDVDNKYQKTFQELINCDSIIYIGKKTNSEIMELYAEIFCVIVPSLWLENYPNTVLESIANKTLVIGSNRGGIPELIGYENLLFDITNLDDLYSKIKYVINISKPDYEYMVNQRYKYIFENNSSNKYCSRIEKIIKKITNKDDLC